MAKRKVTRAKSNRTFVPLIVLVAISTGGIAWAKQAPVELSSPITHTIDIRFADGKLSPDRIVVKQGDTVDLTINSDDPKEYDFEIEDYGNLEMERGDPAGYSFVADKLGKHDFVIEREGMAGTQQTIGFLEVKPR